MKNTYNVRLVTLCFILYLVLFLNIEQLVGFCGWSLHIRSSVYTIGISAVVLALYHYPSSSSHYLVPLVFALVLYVVSIAFFPSIQQTGSENNISIYIVEILLLSLLVLMASKLCVTLKEIQQKIYDILIGYEECKVESLVKAQKKINNEFNRSRRNQRPLNIIVVEPDPLSYETAHVHFVAEMNENLKSYYFKNKIGTLLSSLVRHCDIVVEQSGRNRFIIVCPEINQKLSHSLLNRISDTCLKKLNLKVMFGVSTFPSESYTFEDLLEKAELQLMQSKCSIDHPFREEKN